MRRLVLLLAVVALAAPSMARAETKTYTAPYAEGPRGGDANNQYFVDADTGQITLIRHQLAGVSGGLGCGGSGPFAFLQVDHEAAAPVTKVTATFSDTIVDPYAFLVVSIYKGDHFVDTHVERGLLLGDGEVTLNVAAPEAGALQIMFGLQVASACPNVDGGTVTYTSVTVTEG